MSVCRCNMYLQLLKSKSSINAIGCDQWCSSVIGKYHQVAAASLLTLGWSRQTYNIPIKTSRHLTVWLRALWVHLKIRHASHVKQHPKVAKLAGEVGIFIVKSSTINHCSLMAMLVLLTMLISWVVSAEQKFISVKYVVATNQWTPNAVNETNTRSSKHCANYFYKLYLTRVMRILSPTPNQCLRLLPTTEENHSAMGKHVLSWHVNIKQC